jgi:UDP-2,3-diacylglucosamine pyrophosphatase LpxH
MARRAFVLSDLHLGTGHQRGRLNIYDDFKEDARLVQLLDRFTALEGEVHLVLNGDIFDLLKVPILGKFPDAIGERLACIKLLKCLRGHPQVIEALGRFTASEQHRLTYLPGNHDLELHFAGAQALFRRALTGDDAHPRVQFVAEPSFTLDGVQFHHGHQFEALHAVDFTRLTITPPGGQPILNLPWGSLFILHVVNELVRERPWLDKVHPFWPMFVGGMLFDARFTSKMIGTSAWALVRARLNPNWWQKRPFDKISRFLRSDIAFFEHLDRYAERLFKAHRELRAIFMGHTHVPMVRTWRLDGVTRAYVNTGTWIPMVDLGIARLGQRLDLHYGAIEWRDGEVLASLHRWHGQRAESEEVIA